MAMLGPRFINLFSRGGSSASGSTPSAGKILLADGTSNLLQADGTSKIIKAS